MSPTHPPRGVWVWAWAWAWACVGVDSFNLSPAHSRLFNGSDDSKFGFSVALWSDADDARRVVVGAPRGKESTAARGELVLGNVYYCTNTSCIPDIRLPVLSQKAKSVEAVNPSNDFTMKGQGIGMGHTLAVLDKPRSNLAACAPRYPRITRRIENRGACFVLASPSADPETIVFADYNIPKPNALQDAMLGFSVAISDETNSLVAGGPKAYQDVGVVMRKSLNGDLDQQNRFQLDDIMKGYLEGWAVALGKFDSISTFIAASAVNYGNYTGMVTFYALDTTMPLPGHADTSLYGRESGEKFGYSLASGDLDGDGADDLVVGSPWAQGRTKNHPDAGRVTVYYAPLLAESVRREPDDLLGFYPYGQFGLALAILGDLNLDGYNDLAVSSPYGGKDGTGVIYIYNGAASGLLYEMPQAIHASDFAFGLRGFGFSLDGGLDLDGNLYPDVVIGAPESNQALLIRSSPVITLLGEVYFEVPSITAEEKACNVSAPGNKQFKAVCFPIKVNISYTSSRNLSDLDLIFRMTLEGNDDTSQFGFRSNNDPSYSRQTHAKFRVPRIWSLTVFVKRDRTNIGLNLRASVSVSLPPTDSGGALAVDAPVPPALDRFTPTSFIANTTILCRDNLTCFSQPDIAITALGKPVVIGENPLQVNVTLEVLDDPAYNIEVEVKHSELVGYMRASGEGQIPECKYKRLTGQLPTNLVCKLKFVKEDAMVNFSLLFNYSSIQLLEEMSGGRPKKLALSLSAVSDTEGDNDWKNNKVEIEVEVKTSSVLHTQRDAQPETQSVTVNQTATTANIQAAQTKPFPVNRLGPLLVHRFSLTNRGPSPVQGGKLVIHLPLYLESEQATYFTELPITEGPVTCNTSVIHLNPLALLPPVKEVARRPNTSSLHTTTTTDLHTATTATPPYTTTTTTPPHTNTDPSLFLHTSEELKESPLRRQLRQVSAQDDPSSTTLTTSDPLYDILTTFDPEQPVTPGRQSTTTSSNLVVECWRPECAVTCEVGLLMEGDSVKVSFSSYLVTATVSKGPTIRAASIQSSMQAEVSQANSHIVNAKMHARTYISLVRPQEDNRFKIPQWTFPVAVLVALLLILIIIAILCKAGFFKRNRPPTGRDRASLMPPSADGGEIDSTDKEMDR